MIDNFLYSVLPFYDSVAKQNFKKDWMHYDLCTSALISPKNRFLPFQFVRATKYNPIVSLKLYCYDGTFIEDLLGDIPAGDIDIITAQAVDYTVYYGNKDLTDDLPCGFHYLEAYDGVQYWFSEVFKVIDFSFTTIKKVVQVDTLGGSAPNIIVASDIANIIILTESKT